MINQQSLEGIFGTMALLVVLYRILYFFIPEFQKALSKQSITHIMKSFTLLV